MAQSVHFDALSAHLPYFDEGLTAFINQTMGYVFLTFVLTVYAPCVSLAN